MSLRISRHSFALIRFVSHHRPSTNLRTVRIESSSSGRPNSAWHREKKECACGSVWEKVAGRMEMVVVCACVFVRAIVPAKPSPSYSPE